MRGEYRYQGIRNTLVMGSPPLAWGILFDVVGVRAKTGITPTCVGNTDRPCRWPCTCRDHPHLRGEYEPAQEFKNAAKGSPPLAWGIPHHQVAVSVDDGITPTCVGNTEIWDLIAAATEDHPHLRGEYCHRMPYIE